MALPAAIQAQVEQADKILAAMNAPPETPATAEPAPQAQEVDLSQLAQSASTANATPEVAAPAPAPQLPSTPVNEDTWERKFKSLQGIFNKEVPMLQGQVKELTRRLEHAVEQIEQSKRPPETPEPQKPQVDAKDVENFGSDLVEMVHRVAGSMLGNVGKTVEAELGKVVERLSVLEQRLNGTNQTVAATAEEKFFDRVVRDVPDWEKINVSQAFIDWLQEVDPVYGIPRQAALAAARQQLDSTRVVNIFKAFIELHQQAAPTASSPVDKQVSPKTGAASAAPTPSVKSTITTKQISDFYNDLARRKFVGREAEAQAIEQAINLAIAEGRVR